MRIRNINPLGAVEVPLLGRIVEAGPAEELFDSDNAFVRQFLSGEATGPLGME